MKNLVTLFNQVYGKQVIKGNKEAVDEGTKIMKELIVIKRPTATTTERIDRTINRMIDYVEKWTA